MAAGLTHSHFYYSSITKTATIAIGQPTPKKAAFCKLKESFFASNSLKELMKKSRAIAT
jgi:hypothetical protein